MKKQLLLLSLSLLLASCGGTPANSTAPSQPAAESSETTSESAPAESTPETPASSETEKTKADIAVDLFTTLAATGNCTYYTPSTSTVQYLGGDKGVLTIVDASRLNEASRLTGYGYARLANYGIVSYYYVNDTAGVDASTTTIASPNKNLTFEEFNNSAKDLGECGKLVTFAESTRTGTLSTSDADFIAALLQFDGKNSSMLDYYTNTKATLTLNDAGTEMTVSYVLKGSTDTENYPNATVSGMVISKIGTTKNTSVESYLASNITLTAPTTWSADALSFFGSISTGLTVPFPSQATYAASMPLTQDEDDSSYLLFEDLGCGNIVSTYGASLVAAGFAADAANTGSQNGVVYAGYTKTFASANPMEGSIQMELLLVYQTASAAMQKYYPNGVFAVYAYIEQVPATVTNAQVNTYLSSYKLRWANTTNAFPTLDFGTNCTKIEFTDLTEAAEEYYNELYAQYAPLLGYTSITVEFDIFASLYAYYATQAEATAAKTTIAAALTTAGYTESNPTEYPDSYTLEDDSSEWTYEVDLKVATNSSTGAYAGYLSVSFSAQKVTAIQ